MTDGVLVLDKPPGITSFRAVERVSRILKGRKCGHAGTLDPIATGVLPVCVGRATKIAGYLAAREKEYEAFLRFGRSTETGDAEGRTVEEAPGAFAPREAVEAAVASLPGTFGQTPPAFSAVKVGGTRSYELARRGEAVPLPPKRVTVHEARLLSWSAEGFGLFLRCSKGFYVRALPRDLREALGVPTTVEALRRTRCGPFGIGEAVTLERFAEAARRGEAGSLLAPIERALEGFPQWEIPPEAARAVRFGRSPGPWLAGREGPGSEGPVLLTCRGAGPVALVERESSGLWRIVRGL